MREAITPNETTYYEEQQLLIRKNINYNTLQQAQNKDNDDTKMEGKTPPTSLSTEEQLIKEDNKEQPKNTYLGREGYGSGNLLKPVEDSNKEHNDKQQRLQTEGNFDNETHPLAQRNERAKNKTDPQWK